MPSISARELRNRYGPRRPANLLTLTTARFGLAILRYPSGRYGFVGSVPAALADQVYQTEEAAIEAVLAIGITRFQRADCSWYTVAS